MKHAAEPAPLLRRRLLGKRPHRRGEQNQSGKKGCGSHALQTGKRCKSCQTLYQSAMRSALVAALVLLLAAHAHAASPHCVFRVHVAANANDGSVFAQPIRSLGGRNLFIEKNAWLSERDVQSFYPYRAADGSYGALLQLDDHGRTVLDTLSIERRGSYLFVFINGRALTELLVDRRVSDGKIYLASGLSEADLKLMAKDWKLTGGGKRN